MTSAISQVSTSILNVPLEVIAHNLCPFLTLGCLGRLALVCKYLKVCSESNIAWYRFLPPRAKANIKPEDDVCYKTLAKDSATFGFCYRLLLASLNRNAQAPFVYCNSLFFSSSENRRAVLNRVKDFQTNKIKQYRIEGTTIQHLLAKYLYNPPNRRNFFLTEHCINELLICTDTHIVIRDAENLKEERQTFKIPCESPQTNLKSVDFDSFNVLCATNNALSICNRDQPIWSKVNISSQNYLLLPHYIFVTANQNICIFDSTTYEQTAQLNNPCSGDQMFIFDDQLYVLPQELAGHGPVTIWDVYTLKSMDSIFPPSGTTWKAYTASQTLHVGLLSNGVGSLLDPRTKEVVGEFNCYFTPSHKTQVMIQNPLIICADSKTLKLFDIRTFKELRSLKLQDPDESFTYISDIESNNCLDAILAASNKNVYLLASDPLNNTTWQKI
jgi:hypothetical protein